MRRWWIAAGLGLACGAPRVLWASDGGTGGSQASINPELEAPRFLPGSDAGAPGHFNDFSPLAINYSDCVQSIDLAFTLDLANAPAGDEIQVWAGEGSADCTQPSARTAGGGGAPDAFPGRCWPVAPAGTFSTAGATSTARLHVRDLVAYIGQSTIPVTYAATTSAAVCQPAGTTSVVSLGIYFLFVPAGSGSGKVAAVAPDGVSGLYTTPAALVGPWAPTNVAVPNSGITPTSLTVTWAPQGESTIQGYNVYAVDQGPGGSKATAATMDSGATQRSAGIVCRQWTTTSCAPPPTADAGKDAGTGDAGDAGLRDATLADAGTGDGGTDASTVCDGGLSDALAPVDAAAYANVSDAALAAMGCAYVYSVSSQSPGAQGAPSCSAASLENVFTVDGGLGSVATSTSDAALTTSALTLTDSGADGSAGDTGATSLGSTALTNVPEVAGISNVPITPDYVAGATSSSYTVSGLITGDQYAIAVAAVDSYGNVGPLGVAPSPTGGSSGYAACSTPTAVDDFYTAYGNDGGMAGGGYCSLIAAGAPAPFFGSIFGGGLVAAAIARAKRRRSQRRTS